MLRLLTSIVMLSLATALAAANTPGSPAPEFTGEGLAKGQGQLVEDPGAPGRKVWQVAQVYEFGAGPELTPGLYRVRLRLKRTASGDGELRLGLGSGIGRSEYQDAPAAVMADELPELDQWYEITRAVRVRGPRYWLTASGSWPNLRIDRIALERVTEPVFPLELRTSKLLYHLKEPATATVRLVNTTAQRQSVSIQVRLENGLDNVDAGVTREVTLAPQTTERILNGKDVEEVKLPLPQLAEYGNAVMVKLTKGSLALGEMREYCYASDQPMQVGQYFSWHFPNDYTGGKLEEQFAQMRHLYFPVAECAFWAPCDTSDLTPDAEKWWSGQTLLRMGKKPLQDTLRQGHALGLSFVSYATRWGFGWRMWEFARRHPDLVQWEMRPWQPNYDVAHMETEARERDEEHSGLNSTGVLTSAWGNPEAVADHVRQLQASMQMFGWDGFRYDNGSPLLDDVEDIFGRTLPLKGWTHAQVVATIRSGIRKENPRAIYGNNTGWNLDLASKPREDDPYTQQARDGGLIMQEGETNGTVPHHSFAEEASRYTRAGYNALRFGGHQVNIIDGGLPGADHFFQVALTVAGSCHVAYSVREPLRPLMQLVCRHCDLFYGDGLHFILRPPTPVVEVSGPPNVLWRDFVRYRQVSPARRQYLVHLFNTPTRKLGESKEGNYPDPVTDLASSWTLPPGWKPTAAYELTPDGGYHKSHLSFHLTRGKVDVALPKLRRWSIIVVDAVQAARIQQKQQPSRLQPRLDTDKTGAGPALTGPVMVASAGKDVAYTSITMRCHPRNEPTTRHAAEFEIPDAQIVDVQGAEGGRALRLGASGLGNGIGFAPEIPRPGRYRIVIRALTLQPPPPGAALFGNCGAVANEKTPGIRGVLNEFRFTEAAFKTPGTWVELTHESELTYPNYWFSLRGGWDGLVIDTIQLVRLRDLTWDELARYVNRPWPTRLAKGSSGPLRAWCGMGLYYKLSRVTDALDKLGITADLAPSWRFRDTVGFSRPFPKSPEELGGYDFVVLANCEARSLSPEQQLWLDGYVRDGGRLLVLGGPYGFGCGGWQDEPLLERLLPVTVTNHDLHFVGRAKPVELLPISSLARKVDWSAHPVVLWQHTLTPKAGAVVHVSAGGHPVVLSWTYGRGAVLAIGAAPLGEAPSGAVPYWEWPQWKELLVELLRPMLPNATDTRR